MSAQSLQVITLDIPNPEWQTGFGGSQNQAQRVNASLSFNYISTFTIRTLSSQGASHGNDVTGLLYVPDLDSDDPCVNATAAYIPKNVTRQANLPNTDYDLIAIAPWVSGSCALSYMEAARQDPVRGMFVFVPGNTTTTPADAKDPQWDIPGDSNGKWKSRNGYPVYAISGVSGATLMNASAEYSGNMTDVPNGHELTEYYDSRDYVRLYVDIDTGSGSSLPSLWVFLLVVLGILLAIIGLTSLSMHWLQRRRRQNLRRRVQSGEVDLEALGIKRLTVPQELLQQMPLYTYGSRSLNSRPTPQQPQKDMSVEEEKSVEDQPTEFFQPGPRPAPVLRSTSFRPSALSQPTCAICLDDFVPASPETGEGTTVRELPCHHIFHPECVDTFLRDSSSLCPLCKKSSLPKGYCPRVITNAMVRRERLLRQVRERIVIDPDSPDEVYPSPFGQRVRSMPGIRHWRQNRRVSSAPLSAGQQMVQLESGAAATPGTSAAPGLAVSNSDTSRITRSQQPVQPPATASHRDWAQQRAENMLGSRRAPEDPEIEESRATPAWRKAMRGLFPRR